MDDGKNAQEADATSAKISEDYPWGVFMATRLFLPVCDYV
jgi:hypothetical protein